MRKLFSVVLFLLPLFSVAGGTDTLKFWIQLKDKAASPYSTNKPEEFLSKRAIERRKKFSIPVTQQDFPVNPAYMQQIAATGVKVLNTSRWLNGLSVQTNDNTVLKKLTNLPFIQSVDKIGVHSNKDNSSLDYLMEVFQSLGDDDDDKKDGKKNKSTIDEYTEAYYGQGYAQAQMLNAPALHKLGYTGNGVVVAILDGGFMNVHKIKTFKHLYKNNLLLGTWDFVRQDSNVFDDTNHGMNVLSCMAAKTPGQMVGTAPGAMFWLLRTEDANTEYVVEEYNWATGAEFADSAGADIINSSLGYSVFDDNSTSHIYGQLNGKSSVASRAAAIAAQKGIIVCNAAGNEGNDDWTYIGTPGDAEGILTIGGVNNDSTHADFSSYGPTADGRIKPEVSALATNAYVANVNDVFRPSQGTSFATPILCGAVACLRQAHPDKTVKEIINAIELSATKFAHPDTVLGYGIPDFLKAHRYLGGDKSFNYKKDHVETPGITTFSNAAGVVIYLHKKENVEAKIMKTGSMHSIAEQELLPAELEKGFHKIVFTGVEGLKPGAYTVSITIGGNTHYVNLTKE
jgi:serine protease AprX